MRLAALIAPALILSLSTPAFADEPAPSASPAPVKPKKVCRRSVETGSIVPKITCHTSEEWQAIDAQNSADTERYANQRSTGGGLRSN